MRRLSYIFILLLLFGVFNLANAQQFSVGANIGLPKGVAIEVTYHEMDGFTTGWAARGSFGIFDLASFSYGARVDALYRTMNANSWISANYWGWGLAYTDYGAGKSRLSSISIGPLFGAEFNVGANTALFYELGIGIPIPFFGLDLNTSSNQTVDGKIAVGALQAVGWGLLVFLQDVHLVLGVRVHI
jgi:hypothetical protein